MKAGTSSLNPYAASYIPLSKRGASNENKEYKLTTKDSNIGNEAVWLGLHCKDAQQSQHQRKDSKNYNTSGAGLSRADEDSTRKQLPAHGFYGSSSQNPTEMTEKQILDEEFDMDLAYLQMTFPGISDESLSDVYLANRGDLEATIDMLSQLELYTSGSSENLPDTLDIGDVSEYGSSSECAPLKLKKVAGEVGGSTGSSDSALVT